MKRVWQARGWPRLGRLNKAQTRGQGGRGAAPAPQSAAGLSVSTSESQTLRRASLHCPWAEQMLASIFNHRPICPTYLFVPPVHQLFSFSAMSTERARRGFSGRCIHTLLNVPHSHVYFKDSVPGCPPAVLPHYSARPFFTAR